MLGQIQGQSHAVEAIRRAFVSGRLHHAYLFAGPDGVGKGLLATAYVSALLCPQRGAQGDACSTCSTCLRVRAGSHPDVHRVARREKDDGGLEPQIKIEAVRDLQHALSFKPFEANYRVVIIYEADRMNASTANALLKTLEEPGANTHFVLITALPNLLLPTILSRCQRIRFAPLSRAFVAAHLSRECELDPVMADLVAGLAEGSIGKGRALCKSELLAERAALLARVEGRDEDDVALPSIRRVPEALSLAESLAGRKAELPFFFQLVRTWYRDVMLSQAGMRDEQLVHRDRAALVHKRASELKSADVLERLVRVNDTERALDQAANVRLSLETLLLRLARG